MDWGRPPMARRNRSGPRTTFSWRRRMVILDGPSEAGHAAITLAKGSARLSSSSAVHTERGRKSQAASSTAPCQH